MVAFVAGSWLGPVSPPPNDVTGWRAKVSRLRSDAPNTPRLADALDRLAASLAPTDADAALEALSEAWALRLRLQDDPVAIAATGEALVRALRAQRRFEEAYALAPALNQVLIDPGVAGTRREANLLYLLGSTASLLSRYHEARTWLSQAERAASVLAPDGSVALATVQRDLGIANHLLARYAEAEVNYGKALRTAERIGASPVLIAGITSNLGQLAKDTGRYDEAEGWQVQALNLTTPTDAIRPAIENNLATLYDAMGRNADARAQFVRAAEGFAARGAVQNAATALNNLALNQLAAGDAATAQATLAEVERLYQATLVPNSPLWSTLSLNQSRASAGAGDLDRAATEARKAVAGLLRQLPARHPDVADGWRWLGEVEHRRGHPAGAIRLFERSSSAEQASLPPDHPFLADSQVALGWALMGVNRDPRAAFTRSAQARARHIDRTAIGLSPESASARAATDRTLMDAAAAVARRHPDQAGEAYRWVLNLRGRATSAQLALRRSLWAVSRDPEVADLLQRARAAREEAVGEGTEARAARQKSDALEGELNRTLVRRGVAVVSPGWVSGRSLHRALGPRFLVEFLRVRDRDPHNLAPRADRYGAFLVGGGRTRYVDLGEADALDRVVAQYRLQVQLLENDQELAQLLYRRLVAPLQLPRGANDVVLAPDGGLHFLPFEALMPDARSRWVDRVAIRRVTTGRDLLEAPVTPRANRPMVVAAPDFDATPAGSPAQTQSSPTFVPLPGAEGEGQALRQAWPHAEVRTGAQATEPLVAVQAAPEWLHLATHGFADLGDLLGKDAPLRLRQLAATNDPLVRAGVALAGANRSDQWTLSAPSDGILTAAEVSGMNLRGTRLVVLSACNTGRGDGQAGEGLFGLRRALAYAGAEASLVNVYLVDDRTARGVTTRVVGALRSTQDPASALAQVQRELRQRPETAHPLFWSGWALSGAPRPGP